MTRAKDISKIVTDADLSGTLEVTNGASGASANAAADELVLQNSGDAGLSILSPNANNSQILLGSPVANAGGIIRWTGDDNAVKIGTNNTGSTLRFHVGGFSEVMRISSAGNVGIGTSSPSEKLEINSGTGNIGAKIVSTDSLAVIAFKDNSTTDVQYLGANGDNLVFHAGTSPSERMRIDSSGNVGIGTSTAHKRLTVGDSDETAYISAGGSNVHLTLASIGSAGTVIFRTGGTNGNATTTTERMRVNSSGNVLVGTTTYGQPNANAVALGASEGVIRLHHINGTSNGTSYAIFTYNGLGIGSITQNTTSSVAFNTTSDHRLKENVTADWDATTRLKQLNPVRFNFITDADTTVDGFLAHEVQSVVPEAITGTHNEVDDNGNPVYQQIDQSKLVPLLVKTIQELEARIVALETA